MKLVIIGVVALLVLGGSAAGAYYYFGHPAEAALVEGAIPEAPAHEEKSAENAIFVQLDPLTLPILDESGANQIVSLVVMLEVSSEENADKVKKLTPRLKDAFIQDMYGVLNRKASTNDGVLQVGTIKKRLNDISDRVMGEDVVDDVLLQVVEQRPL